MKKSSVMMLAAVLMFSSCGTLSQLASYNEGQAFQDGIYTNTPDFRSREEKVESRAKTDDLIAKTKESPIYLFGDKKDTVMIPENFAATIRYDQSLGSTVVTVGENPYDWRNNINPWSYYTPYSIGSSWYWSRHWSPYWSGLSWHHSWYNPWFYGWNDPWYYGGYWGRWYDPWDYWGYWGWGGPWYHGGYWYPHYAGWYGGFGPHWGHHHHHGHGPGHGDHFGKDRWYGPRHDTQNDERVLAREERTTVRRGIGSSSSVSRGNIGGSTSRATVTGADRTSSVRRAVTSSRNSAVSSGKPASDKGTVSSGSTRTYRRPSVTSGSAERSSQSRGTVGTSQSSGYDRGSSVSRSSSNYDRSSSGSSYSRSSSSSPSRSSYGGGGSYSRGSSGSYGGGSRSGGSSSGRR